MSKQFLCVKEGEHFGKLLVQDSRPFFSEWFHREDGYTVRLKPDEIISMDSSLFKQGTRVKVVRKIPNRFKYGMLDKGEWYNTWETQMDKYIGHEGVLTADYDSRQHSGIEIKFDSILDGYDYYFPLAALEIVVPKAFTVINGSTIKLV